MLVAGETASFDAMVLAQLPLLLLFVLASHKPLDKPVSSKPQMHSKPQNRRNIEFSTIQILGRWFSQAVERYVQQAPLVALPAISSKVLNQRADADTGPIDLSGDEPIDGVVDLETAAPPPHDSFKRRKTAMSAPSDDRISELESQLAALKASIVEPTQTLVHRSRATVVHLGLTDEYTNNPDEWRTRCGWAYGLTKFFRLQEVPHGFRRCRKCFPEELGSVELDSDDSEHPSSSSSDSSSSIVSHSFSGWVKRPCLA